MCRGPALAAVAGRAATNADARDVDAGTRDADGGDSRSPQCRCRCQCRWPADTPTASTSPSCRPELVAAVSTLEELAHAGRHPHPEPEGDPPRPALLPPDERHARQPVFRSAPLDPGQSYEPTFTIPGDLRLLLRRPRPSMAGRVTVEAGGTELRQRPSDGRQHVRPSRT